MAAAADTAGIEGGNFYDKYGTQNPIERRLVAGFMRSVAELAAASGAREGHEVGCGEGELSIMLARRGVRMRGTDVSGEAIAEARRRTGVSGAQIELAIAGVESLDRERDAAELVVCCEVLEHLAEPAAAVDALARLARPWLLASVPREPLWRALNLARGKYASRAGNTPGHLNHWSRRGFTRQLSARFEIVETRSPLPWSMALCRVRDA